MSALDKIRSRPRIWASAALVTVGVTTGAILGSTFTASAATSGTSTTTPSSSSSTPAGNPANRPAGAPPMAGCQLPDSGTVSSVGSSSVTIDGKTYSVTSNSDIDKNGEASLSDLAAGDKVTFSTVANATSPTIDKLHAGNEALDRPAGPPMGGPQGAPQQSSGSTSTAA